MFRELCYLFPAAVPGVDFVVQDDGEGPFISAWKLPGAKPSPAELEAATLALARAARASEVRAALAALDAASARPLRSIVAGTASQEDRDRLLAIENEAAALRAELSALEQSPA